ncbi:hypothetical protein Bca4012_097923 [Brassica carinata]
MSAFIRVVRVNLKPGRLVQDKIVGQPFSVHEFKKITYSGKHNLCSLQNWSFHRSDQRENTIAQDIAASVTSERRYQSYIAFGAPSWISRRVESEAGA